MDSPCGPDHGPFDGVRFSRFQLAAVILCGLIAMLDGFDTQAIGYAAPKIADDWGVRSSEFGPIFSAGLFGFAAGSLFLGALADKYGRKPVLIAATICFGVFALLSAWADSLHHLFVLRFLTGIGLGAAVPNTIALTSEYAPTRIRAIVVMTMICGFPLGSTIGGIFAAPLMETYGWRSVFILGGTAPLIVVPLLIFALPESARFLAVRGGMSEKLRSILCKIDPTLSAEKFVSNVRAEVTKAPKGWTVPQLFAEGRTATTLLLWVVFFNGLLVYYFMISWLPTLVRESGLPLSTAIYATAAFNLGGVVGAIVLAALIDRWSHFLVLGLNFAACAVFVAMVAFAGGSPKLLLVAAALAGVGSSGGQIGSNALSAIIYPTAIRSTGVGWALGVGRAGAITGPLLAGVMLGAGWTPKSIIMSAVAPALVCSVAVSLLGVVFRKQMARRPSAG